MGKDSWIHEAEGQPRWPGSGFCLMTQFHVCRQLKEAELSRGSVAQGKAGQVS